MVTAAFLTLLIATVVAGASVDAHHSFAAHYFEDQTVSIEGELVEFEYRSPHAWVHVMARDQSGQVQRFSAEWASVDRLRRAGVAKDTLKPGDYVIASGSPGRNPAEHRLHLKSIQRPSDGWSWRGRRQR
jgi:hypothetical protein